MVWCYIVFIFVVFAGFNVLIWFDLGLWLFVRGLRILGLWLLWLYLGVVVACCVAFLGLVLTSCVLGCFMLRFVCDVVVFSLR